MLSLASRLSFFALPLVWGFCSGQSHVVAFQVTSLDELEQQAFQAASDFAQESVVQVEAFGGLEFVNQKAVSSGPSTGTVLTSDGWIASSMFYFRAQPASITVLLPNGIRKPAKLVARDYSREIAILKIEPDSPLTPAVPSDPASWQIGQWTIALGKTFDIRTASRSVGILSARGRIFDKAIQTDCKISPQNYGGPLIDLHGKVMGILTLLNPSIATEEEVEQWYDSGIGFAVPLQDVLARLPKLRTGQDIHPGKIGIRTRGRDEFREGLSLIGVGPGSPAAKAGLLAGDKILRAGPSKQDLKPVLTYMQFRHVVSPIDAEQDLVLEVERAAEKKIFEMKLVKDLPEYREPYLGIVTTREPDFAERVLHVVKGGPAEEAGLVIGDRISKLFGLPFQKEKNLEQSLWFLDFREPIQLTVRDESGQEREVTIQSKPRLEGDISLPKIDFPMIDSDEGMPDNTIQQLPMGDVRNRAFAIVPATYRTQIPHGLLIVFADAGQQESKKWADRWEKFASENRWIIAVIQSAEEKGWTFEEVEIAGRVRSQLMNQYTIDPRRRVIAGHSSAAILGIIASSQNPLDYNAIWISDGKLPGRIRLMSPEPGQPMRIFLNGLDESMKRFASLASQTGYNVNFYPQVYDRAQEIVNEENSVAEKVQRWLRFLETY